MMRSSPISCRSVPGCFDLQIIQGWPQVKNAECAAGPRRFPRFSLGFKQLARSLHAPFDDGRLACGHRHHRNKLRSWMLASYRRSGEEAMKQQLKLAGLAVLLSVETGGQAIAQEKLKIGVIVTLSGPAAALGVQVRDGFELAINDLGGKMAGRDVKVVVADDELKPDAAVSKVKGLLERDKVDFVVGPIFSNILLAIHKPVIDTKT